VSHRPHREGQILELDFGRLEHPRAVGGILDGLGRADGQAPDMELMQVAVGPSEGCLQHLVKLRKIEITGQFQRASDLGLDADNPGFERMM
jgi:hypothetical protein